MGQIRYGARSLDQLRNREVEATSVKTWATTLVAVYETDPDVVAAGLPPPLTPFAEPLVRGTIAAGGVGRGYPVFGARTLAVMCRHEGGRGDHGPPIPVEDQP